MLRPTKNTTGQLARPRLTTNACCYFGTDRQCSHTFSSFPKRKRKYGFTCTALGYEQVLIPNSSMDFGLDEELVLASQRVDD